MRFVVKSILFVFLAFLVLSQADEDAEDNNDLEKILKIDCTLQRFNKLEHNVDTLSSTIASIDSNMKNLQEKSLVWDLFRHHIESWNEQIKSLDHKIDLIKRTQDENKIIETKLISLEFTLNHVLSKVVYMTDTNYNRENDRNDYDEKLIEIHKILTLDKNLKSEMSTRLSNILRHVLNIENENCRSPPKLSPVRLARVMQPIGIESDGAPYDDIESILKAIELKVDNLTKNLSSKDLKQLTTTNRKNLNLLEDIKSNVKKIDERTIRIFDVESQNTHLITNCQSISNEITTFTDNSDLLLKRIEKLVLNLQSKVDIINVNKKVIEDDSPGPVENDGDINYDEAEYTTKSNEHNDSVEREDDTDFVQPYKSGCHELEARIDGIYKFASPVLNAAERDANERYCAFPTPGIGYTVIQNRGPFLIQEVFNRSWIEYRDGFGSLSRDFWFGNEFVHNMTFKDNYELRIELQDFDNNMVWAEYSTFYIDSEDLNYPLMIGSYRGSVTDSMLYSHGLKFSTYDRRNDKSTEPCCACATGYGSGWWFDNCSEANLNGIYQHTPKGHNFIGIIWEHWHGDYSLRSARMLIRPKKTWSNSKDDMDILF